jgi:putative hydrolase of the HAD superfamily
MQIQIKPNTFFIFDLDDTLYPEIDFVKSGFKSIAAKLAPLTGADLYAAMWLRYQAKENVFQWIIDQYGSSVPEINMNWLLKEYREHLPEIILRRGVSSVLHALAAHSIPAGLLTDGRSITQRNKLKALHIENHFSDIIISEEFGSEKPDERNYLYFLNKYPGFEFYVVGDNTTKDFVVPGRLGWCTICIKNNGTHIHQQTFGCEPYPSWVISSFDQIRLVK